ncbi:MAG: lipopolysaccharide heptosyltransferase II [Candidatus Acidiferrum sp.]
MKILIRATNWVGDAIMALPALRAVRSRFPEAEITILARPYVAAIYKDQQVCDDLMDADNNSNLLHELRAHKFDAALLLQNAFHAAWLAWRAGIPERIGYARDGRGLLLTKAVPVPKSGEIPVHEQYYYLELLRRAGWLDSLPDETFIKLNVPEENAQRAAGLLLSAGANVGRTRIAIGAGASYGSAKCWPPNRFAELANRLQARADIDVLLFGTPAEAAVSSAISSGMRRPPIDLTGKTSIADLPALLSQCHLFIGNDSGAMHVAAAVGLPVIAVFGPTDPHGTAPVTPRCIIVQEKPYCSPCFLRRCPTDHRCMTSIAPSAVESAARQWISSTEVHPV